MPQPIVTDEKIEQMATKLAAAIAVKLEKRFRDGGGASPIGPDVLPLAADCPRARHERRIRFLVNRYGLQWLVDQYPETVETMPPEPLAALALDCERALQCLQDGVSFEDVGLVRYCA